MGRGREEREKLPPRGAEKITLGGPARGKGALKYKIGTLSEGTPNLGFGSRGDKTQLWVWGSGLHPPILSLGILGATGMKFPWFYLASWLFVSRCARQGVCKGMGVQEGVQENEGSVKQ